MTYLPKKPLALFAAALMLSGCVPAPTTTPQIAALTPQAMGLGDQPAPHLPNDWLKAFHDPQVDRLITLLGANNPTLAAALARIRAAEAELSVAYAQNLPQVTLDGSAQRGLLSNDYIYPPPFAGSDRWIGQVQANLTWNIDFWGKQADLIEKAHDTAEASALDAASAQLALAGAFAGTYIDLWLAYENGDAAAQTVADRTQILKITQSRFSAGLENASAIEQAKALVALAKADERRFAAQREMDAHAIAALTGQGAAAYATITRPSPQIDSALPLPSTLPADLLSRRPDILAARARVDAATKGRDAAHAEFYPDVNIAAFAGWSAIGLSNLFTGGALDYAVGPAIHLPIFDAGKIRANYANATAELDVAVADYNNAVLNAVRQSADALTQVKSAEGQRGEQAIALASATRALHLAEERYKDGLSTQVPMLTAEGTLLTARQQTAALAAQSITQRITLLLSVGGSFNADAIAQQDTPHE